MAQDQGFSVETIAAAEPSPILAFLRQDPNNNKNGTVYLSAGIHGDEPAGPLAILKLLEEKRLHPDIGWHIIPVLNPWGLAQNQRENADGIDLNRDYRTVSAGETRHHIDWLKTKNTTYSLCLTLHEDCDTGGFYLYELNPDNLPSLAPAILKAGGKQCGIDQSPVIDGYPAKDGVIHLSTDLKKRPHWTETAYMVANHTRQAYTLEAPGKKEFFMQIEAHATAVEAAVEHLRNSF